MSAEPTCSGECSALQLFPCMALLLGAGCGFKSLFGLKAGDKHPGDNQGFVSSPRGAEKLSCRPRWHFPVLTGQGPSFPDPETFWASPGHSWQVSQMQTWLFSHSSHHTHSWQHKPKVWLCLQQLHRSIPVSQLMPVFNWFHSALLCTNFFLKHLSRMTGWGGFRGPLLNTRLCMLRTLCCSSSPEPVLQTLFLHPCCLEQLFGILQTQCPCAFPNMLEKLFQLTILLL